MGKMRSFKTQ